MGTPGAELVRRLAAGDRSMLGPLYDRHASVVHAVILRIVRDPADAGDVVQEVFWEAWETAATFDPDRGTPEAWLLTRARSRALDRVRSRRRRRTTVPPVNEVTADRARQPTEPVDGTSDRARIRTVLERLPDIQREAIELACWSGFTQSEIAERLAQPLGTVRTQIRLGLEGLREALAET